MVTRDSVRSVVLPIDVVPGSAPTRFRWSSTVSGLEGELRRQDCEGSLPAGVEGPVRELVKVAKQALMDNAMLRGQVEGMAKRAEDAERVAELMKKVEPPPATKAKR